MPGHAADCAAFTHSSACCDRYPFRKPAAYSPLRDIRGADRPEHPPQLTTLAGGAHRPGEPMPLARETPAAPGQPDRQAQSARGGLIIPAQLRSVAQLSEPVDPIQCFGSQGADMRTIDCAASAGRTSTSGCSAKMPLVRMIAPSATSRHWPPSRSVGACLVIALLR